MTDKRRHTSPRGSGGRGANPGEKNLRRQVEGGTRRWLVPEKAGALNRTGKRGTGDARKRLAALKKETRSGALKKRKTTTAEEERKTTDLVEKERAPFRQAYMNEKAKEKDGRALRNCLCTCREEKSLP